MLQIVTLSHEGLVRVKNEDCVRAFLGAQGTQAEPFVCSASVDSALVVLADGMGGLMGGEDASHTAAEAVRKAVYDAQASPTAVDDLPELIDFAHQRVASFASELNFYGRMGTTLMVWYHTPQGTLFAHVGDSRCYQWTGQDLRQISHDHTVAQRLEDSGMIEPGRAKYHRQRHVLTQAVGLPGMLQPQCLQLESAPRTLLCSDGLSDLVSEARIAQILSLPDIQEAAGELLRCALDEGGNDNISIAIIEHIEPE